MTTRTAPAHEVLADAISAAASIKAAVAAKEHRAHAAAAKVLRDAQDALAILRAR